MDNLIVFTCTYEFKILEKVHNTGRIRIIGKYRNAKVIPWLLARKIESFIEAVYYRFIGR